MSEYASRSVALRILREHTFRSIGCTDPVGIGLAVARAYALVGGQAKSVHVHLDKNTYKDAIAVGIPGTYAAGLDLAVALALLKGQPDAGLELYREVTSEDIPRAHRLLQSLQVKFALEPEADSIYISARVETSAGCGEVTVQGAHDRVMEERRNGQALPSHPPAGTLPTGPTGMEKSTAEIEPAADLLHQIHTWSIQKICTVVAGLPLDKIFFLQEGIAVNLQAAETGLIQAPGLGLGRQYRQMMEAGLLPGGIQNRIKMLAAAAADMRMGGALAPIFGCYGSGNHGITFFITVGEMAHFLGKDKAGTLRALALGLLVIGVAKTRTGILTPHCGCSVAAGSGAAAAVAFLLGADAAHIQAAIQAMDANLTGMLCDGAKPGCALKIATSAGAAVEAAYLAARGGMDPLWASGILGRDFQGTMDNLQTITERGMRDMDRAVLDILLEGKE